ncbi:transcription antitermination factor NusB [soil metagenome]
MAISRREVRVKIMQVLYAYEMTNEPIEKVKGDILTNLTEKDTKVFADDMLKFIVENDEMIENIIKDKVEHWEIERMAFIDRIILKIGITELLNFPEIPPKVTINEAIDIAKEYCTLNSGRFVNGVLDAVHDELKKEGKLNKTGRGLLNLKKKEHHETPKAKKEGPSGKK